MKSQSPGAAPVAVRFARGSTRGLLLGFSAPRVAALGTAGTVAALAVFAGGAMAFAISAAFWLPLGAAAIVRSGGARRWNGSAEPLHYEARKASSQTEFRGRPARPRPSGTLALPGDAASLRLHVEEDSGAAMIHDPHRRPSPRCSR